MRHWLVFDDDDPAVPIFDADDLSDYEGIAEYRIEGPFVLEAEQPRGAVHRIAVLEDALREVRDRWAYEKLIAVVDEALSEPQ